MPRHCRLVPRASAATPSLPPPVRTAKTPIAVVAGSAAAALDGPIETQSSYRGCDTTVTATTATIPRRIAVNAAHRERTRDRERAAGSAGGGVTGGPAGEGQHRSCP